MKICNVTSVHPRYDVRIFYKQCWAQSLRGDTHLVVADSGKDEIKDGIHIHGVKGYKNRFLRMTLAVWGVYRRAKSIKAEIYILHDPELLSIALLLKRTGAKVFFDSHECYTETLQGSETYWISPLFKKYVVRAYQHIEAFVLKRLAGVIAATDHISEIIGKYTKNVFIVHNYALLKEFSEYKQSASDYATRILYCGGITEGRGILQITRALEFCRNDIKLILCGTFSPDILLEQCKSLSGWRKIEYRGYVDRQQLQHLAKKCFCGMCCLLPTKDFATTNALKIFEYAGMYLPVIASDFDLWREIIGNGNRPFGLLVNPENPQEIANAIDKLYENKALAKQLGKNGRNAVETRYNFESEMEGYLKWLEQGEKLTNKTLEKFHKLSRNTPQKTC